ncbi:hypothetical protein WG904_17565 [Pedobacter sp. Du54]|uniref:hypothetical protein n=1 Tax=Pedobacter anseongensis TaxID=3133439 RepID=UPI00309DE09B
MKKHHLILSIRVDVETALSLFETIAELETETDYLIGSTANVTVTETEILETKLPNS